MQHPKAEFGVILAGGRGSRMHQQDKSLLLLGNQPLINWVAESAQPQVDQLLLSVNRNPERFEFLQLPQFSDRANSNAGPLLGIAAAIREARERSASGTNPLLACFPADVPWFPSDLVATLLRQLQTTNSQVAIARGAGRLQPLFSVWQTTLGDVVEQAIEEGLFGPRQIFDRLRTCTVEFPQHDRHFFNINTPQDLAAAEKLV